MWACTSSVVVWPGRYRNDGCIRRQDCMSSYFLIGSCVSVTERGGGRTVASM